jgi:hypothetical protein
MLTLKPWRLLWQNSKNNQGLSLHKKRGGSIVLDRLFFCVKKYE